MDKKIKKIIKSSIRIAPKISKKGELFELRNGLVSQYPQTRKDAIKKTIQQMTVGKDVSSLFPDVLKNIATHDIEQKKLVYLYVINYAESHPELCILAVNTFVNDSMDPNPLIRCMAIRTMSMIRVDKILEYVEVPLRKTLQDGNPYVRKTAVICVAKLFHLNKELFLLLEILDDLINCLDDTNPMVVANTIASLLEIHEMDPSMIKLYQLIQSHVSKFLLALNECTEWARITILTALSQYQTKDSLEAQDITHRVIPHLQHVNPAVVLASIKVIVSTLPNLSSESTKIIMPKISTALVSLMSTPPEMQYVALRNIRILLQKYPNLLANESRIFYVKFNDPLYVKLEKLDILVRLVLPDNLKQCNMLLNELKEYSVEFEPDFVSRSIQAISQLTIKVNNDKFSAETMDILCSLIQDRDMFQDEILIAICDLVRYNNKLYKISLPIISSWEEPEQTLQTDNSKCNYIWYLGQFGKNGGIKDLEAKLQQFLENFSQHGPMTQMSLLITIIKLNDEISGLILQKVLELATTGAQELDLRDMAMVYWRCLSIENASTLINELCSTKLPVLNNSMDQFTPELLETLLKELASLSSIYFKPSSQFEKVDMSSCGNTVQHKPLNELKNIAHSEIVNNLNDDILLDLDDNSQATSSQYYGPTNTNILDELNDLFDFNPLASMEKSIENLDLDAKHKQSSSNTQDLLDLF